MGTARRQGVRTARPRTAPWPALLVLCLANFLILLDTTIVNTALPDIQRSLGAGIDQALWVLNGFLLAFASLLIVAGRLGDLLGPRTVFVAGLAVFTAASVLCAASRTPEQLIAARVLQGTGAAALLPQALVLITVIFPAERHGTAFGVFTAVAGIASVSGPTVGGLLVTGFGWQSIFALNVPFGLLGIVLACRLVPAGRGHAGGGGRRGPVWRHRFDPVGVLLATAGLSGIAYGLVEGQRHGWGRVAGPVTIPRTLAAAGALLVLFVLWERRQPEPLLPLGLFRNRTFAVVTLLALITSFALFGLLLVYVLQTQVGLGMSPLASGLSALPWTATLSLVAPVAGRLADRTGGRALLAGGLLLLAAGTLALALAASTASTAGAFVLPLVVVGAGIGLTVAPTTTEAMRAVPPEQAGAASGVLNTARQAGAVVGAALTGAVLQNRLTAALRREPLPAALLAASRPTLAVVAAVVLLGGLLALLVPGRRPAAPVAASGLTGPAPGDADAAAA